VRLQSLDDAVEDRADTGRRDEDADDSRCCVDPERAKPAGELIRIGEADGAHQHAGHDRRRDGREGTDFLVGQPN